MVDTSGARRNLLIQGETFSIPEPYGEGHVMTAGEANQLNQVLAENIRNNFAKKVSDAKEAGTLDGAAMQRELDQYAQGYEFGVRRAGGGAARITDPVKREALRIAKDAIKDALVKQGKKPSDYTAAQINEKAEQVVRDKPKYMEMARQRLAELSAVQAEDADLVSDMPEAAPEQSAPSDGPLEQASNEQPTPETGTIG